MSRVAPTSRLVEDDWDLHDVRRRAATGSLYAVLDACDEPVVPPYVVAQGDESGGSLYAGLAEEALSAIAPYLVRASPAVLDWIAMTLPHKGWGVLVESDAPLRDLSAHLRHALFVVDPSGVRRCFRYYDSRVLVPFLRSSDSLELEWFFGPATSYATVDWSSRAIRRHRIDRRG